MGCECWLWKQTNFFIKCFFIPVIYQEKKSEMKGKDVVLKGLETRWFD